SSRRRHTRFSRDWSSDVCSSDLGFYTNSPKDFGIQEWDARIRRLRFRGDGYILGEKLGYSFQLSFSRGDQDADNTGVANIVRDRSEERRVGREWRCGWWGWTNQR